MNHENTTDTATKWELNDRRKLGSMLITLGALGAIAAVIGTLLVLSLVRSSGESLRTTLEISGDVATLTEDAVEIAAESVTIAASSLDQIRSSSDDLIGTFSTTAEAFEEAGDIVATDVPATIKEVRVTTAGLADAADSFNQALGTLSIIGVSPPRVAVVDSFTEIDRQLEDLAARLQKEGQLIQKIGSDFRSFGEDTAAVQADLKRAADALERIDPLVAGYQRSAQDASATIATASADLESQLRSATAMVIAFGVLLGLSQLGWVVLGRALRGRPDAIAPEPSVAHAGSVDAAGSSARPEASNGRHDFTGTTTGHSPER